MEDTTNFGDLPESLLQEVHQLIDKERTLLELKLLDQQLESEKWRTKYDTLKEKVVESAVEENQVENIEVVANVEMEEGEVHKWESVDEIIAARVIEDCIADLTNIKLKRTMFIALIKNLFGARSPFPNIRVVSMKNCSLSVEHKDIIIHLVRSSRITGIDFSRNDIREDTFVHILDVIGKRKRSPQYLLMDGNIAFSESSKSFVHMFKVLSEDTWGLGISLQDYPSNYIDLMEKELRKTKKTGNRDDTIDIRELVKPTMKIHDFLHALNERVMESKGMQTKSKKSFLNPIVKLSTDIEITERLMNPFKSLTVLSITQCHISRKSMQTLQQSVQLMRDTLTDLDLSFSYMGFMGAEVVKNILSDPQTQLIRLDLKGNVLRDNALKHFVPALRSHPTLTYLNVSGNCFTNHGAFAAYEAVKENPILQYLDFRRNEEITIDCMEEIDSFLRHRGSELYIHWDEFSRPPLAVSEKANASSIVFMRTRAYKKICSVGKSCKLFTLNLSKIYQQAHTQNVPLLFQFFIRPKSVNSIMELEKHVFGLPKLYEDYRRKKFTDDPFFHINTDVRLTWEISVKQKEEVIYKYEMDISNAFVTKNDAENNQSFLFCGFIASQLPKKGILEVRARLTLLLDEFVWESSNSYLALEMRDCLVKYTEVHPWHCIGGDGDCDPAALQRFAHEAYGYYFEFGRGMFIDHSILRAFKWQYMTPKIRVVFESKLAVMEDMKHTTPDDNSESHREEGKKAASSYSSPAVQEIVNAEAKPTKSHEALFYEILVTSFKHHGRVRTIQTIRSELDYTKLAAGTATTTSAAAVEGSNNDPIQAILHSWIWQENVIEIDNVEPGDVVLISAKVTSKDPKILATWSKKCMVLGRNCMIYTHIGEVSLLSTTDIIEKAIITSHPEAIFAGPAAHEPDPILPYYKTQEE